MCGAGTWQMCPICSEPDDCRKAPSITEGKKKADDSSFLNIPISCSQLSSVSNMSESCAPNLVYRRRKQRGNSVAILSADTLAKTKRSADSLSAVSSEAPLGGTTEQHMGSQVQHELVAIGAPILPLSCNREPDVLRFESTNKSSVGEEHGTDKGPNNGLPKIVDVDSVNDSCSSSKSNLELISATTEKIEIDDAGECSSSSMLVVDAIGKDLTGKDLFIAILRRQGLLEKVWPPKICASSEGGGICSSSSCYRSCKICSHSETTSKMLICDNCEDAFHLSCYIPRIKIIPVDEWFCHSCVIKKRGIINDTINKKFPSITSEMGRYRSTSSHCEADPIALMLEDTEPYKSDVRVGKGYQAEVPLWEGPVNNDIDTIIESLEMDPSDSMKLQQTSDQHPRRCPIGNWLQCREVRDGPGSDNGTICGKWRRAPLFEVQTDNWECFCSVLWDPKHADCAVPQELETDQVLKQLKYIEMLKPRLSAKRRKLDHTKSDAKTPVNG